MMKLGWIGTGVMGAAIVRNLMTAGYDVTVYNRTKSKADALVAAGATWADTPAAVAETSDVIFTMVGFPRDVEQVYFGDHGIFSGLAAGKTVIDITRVNMTCTLWMRPCPAVILAPKMPL